MTVHAIDRNVPAEYSSGETRTALDIEACSTATQSIAISGARWTLVDSAGGRYSSDSYLVDPKLPQYPSNPTELLAGECLRGWLVMDVPPGADLKVARYAPTDADGRTLATLLWST